MKNNLFRILLAVGLASLAISCSLHESDTLNNVFQSNDFEARIESPEGMDTKVYADDKLRVLWDEEDHISIFNKYTFNQEYRFTGETGDNSGIFRMVSDDEFVAGNELDLIYAVYPYQESTSIDNDGILTVTLPANQTYREGCFGRGANTMVSCTSDKRLMFRNTCGYLCLKLYGENVSVSSISIKGNNGEPLAGKAVVVSAADAVPIISLFPQATTEINLNIDVPVRLGTTADDASAFWMVIPPVTFDKGFTLTVTNSAGDTFEKSTTKPFSISRNTLSRMSALKVDFGSSSEPIESTLEEIAYYTDGTLVKTKPVRVMAKTMRGFILTDDTRTMLLYTTTKIEDIAVGDIIKVTSTFQHYRELPELSGIISYECLSSGDTPTYPTPTDITDRTDFDDDFFKDFQYISLSGMLKSIRSNNIGISYFVERSPDDEFVPFNIFYPYDYQNTDGYSIGDTIRAEGYFTGFNSSDICIIITSMTITP